MISNVSILDTVCILQDQLRVEMEKRPPQSSAFYISLLRGELARRQRDDTSYSLRSFAKYIGIPASSLALVLKNKRPFPTALIEKTCARLDLSPEQKDEFARSIHMTRLKLNNLLELKKPTETILNEENHFRVIAEWEHYAVLSLVDTENFAEQKIAERLGITELRAQDVVDRLLSCGLLTRNSGGKIIKTDANVATTEDILSPALRKSHKEYLEIGLEKLESIPLELRDFSASTMALDIQRMPEIKKLIRDFRKRLMAFAEKGKTTDVYQICLQLYPLTEVKARKR
jgi:uncharacterized protein (TIGR02147 family)